MVKHRAVILISGGIMSYLTVLALTIYSSFVFAGGSFSYEKVDHFSDQELELLSEDMGETLAKLSSEFKITKIAYINLPEGNYPEHIVHHWQSKTYENIVFNFIGRFDGTAELVHNRFTDMFKEDEIQDHLKEINYWSQEIAKLVAEAPTEQVIFAKGQMEILDKNQTSKEVQSFLIMSPTEEILLIERVSP